MKNAKPGRGQRVADQDRSRSGRADSLAGARSEGEVRNHYGLRNHSRLCTRKGVFHHHGM